MPSHELPLNSVKPFEMCGQKLLAFRSRSGVVRVLSAYCPHLGANIGVGGRVVTDQSGDDCIQCPFHGWRFSGRDGQCKHIPNVNGNNLKTLKSSIKSLQTKEIHGMIFVWYHRDNQKPDYNPDKFLSPLDWAKNGNIKMYHARFHSTYFDTNAENIIENGCDAYHTKFVHDINIPGVFTIDYEWSDYSGSGPICELNAKLTFKLFGWTVTEAIVEAKLHTPTILFVQLSLIKSNLGPFITLSTPLPIKQSRCRSLINIFHPDTIYNKLIGGIIANGIIKQTWPDIVIWVNQQSPKRPVMTKLDQSIIKFRRYCQQFYS